jgi:hypothetical protein
MVKFVDFFNAAGECFAKLEGAAEKLCHLVEKAAPIAEAVAPLAGPYAGAVASGASAAEMIATATDRAIEAHQAAGNSPESAVSSLATIAQAVAKSDVTSDATAGKINSILGALGAAQA